MAQRLGAVLLSLFFGGVLVPDGLAVAAAVTAASGLAAWRLAFHPVVRASDEGVLVRNRWTSSFHPWDEIVHVDPDPFGIRIAVISPGRSAVAVALDDFPPVPFRDRGRAERVAALLDGEARRQARARRDAAVRRLRPRIPPPGTP
jgi:hypothetical protein